MNTRARQEERVPCSRDSEAEYGAHPRTPIAVKKAQCIQKIILKAKTVKEGTESLNYEEKSPVSKMMISPNLGYNDLREAFLKNYLQQKKCIRDPIVLHNIKRRDGQSIEDFIQRYKSESGNVKGAPECMRISGFVHGFHNLELQKISRENSKNSRRNDAGGHVFSPRARGGLKPRKEKSPSGMETPGRGS
ncbi:hypothetical protein Tco_0878876 [Tanacetum coccineum]|uniref:Reverse transcriptase domain-containing protein n=1 Tax=Tanacetum coccineum TaxID=301880 RepID=A0ABQ5BZ28_9ASTR